MLGLGPLLVELARRVRRGVVVVMDYGGGARERWGQTADGTLRAYLEHTIVDPLQAPGRCDITTDVNITALEALAAEAGWDVVTRCSQAAWLAHLGALDHGVPSPGLRQAMHPGGMGERFRAVVLDKGGRAAEAGLGAGDDAAVWSALAGRA